MSLAARRMVTRQRVECIGGWSFLLLALGIFCLLPGTIMAGIYASRSDSRLRVVALVLFCISLGLVFTGIAMCLFWCKNTESGKKKSTDAAMEELTGHRSGDHNINTPLTTKDPEADDVSLPGSNA